LADAHRHLRGTLIQLSLLNRLLRAKATSSAVQTSRKLPAKKFLLPTLPKQVAKCRLSRLLLLQPQLRRLRCRLRPHTRLLRQHQPLRLSGRQTSGRRKLRCRRCLSALKRLPVLRLSKAKTSTLGLRSQRISQRRLLRTNATRSSKRAKRFALCASKRGTRLRSTDLCRKCSLTTTELFARRIHVVGVALDGPNDGWRSPRNKRSTAKKSKSNRIHSILLADDL
jgi:hypothetical protein